jgi:FlaA1/EpsC-like NDP-sugar epimerase
MLRLAIYGSALGGGAGQIIEALNLRENLKPIFILDRDTSAIGKVIFGVPVAGSTEEFTERWSKGEFDEAIVAIGGDLIERKKAYDLITSLNIPVANVIDPGCQVWAGCKVRSGKRDIK